MFKPRTAIGTRMMFPTPLVALIVSLAAWHGALWDSGPAVQRMTVRDDIILNVPISQRRRPGLMWVERKGPKCVSSAMIAGAAMASPESVDFLMRDRSRVRAEFDSNCAGLDFYGSFYIEPQDGLVCAKREEIRSRAGSTCRIERFRRLKAKYKR
jgi:hypothetical protein